MSREISINGNKVQVWVEVNQRAHKTVSIEIRSKDRIKIKVPKGREVDIDRLLEKYQPQIMKKYEVFQSLKPVYENGSILFNGKPRSIKTIQGEVNQVILDEDIITIEHRRDFDPSRLLKQWTTEQTENLLKETTQKYPQLLAPSRVTVTETTRWGYTRKNGVIILNWQLSTLPKELAEYVIIHEFVHLEHQDHSNGFYGKLTALIPDYKQRIEEIKQFTPIP